MGVDFNRYAMFRAGLQDLVDVDLISGTPLQLTAGQMSDDCGMRIADRLENALGLLLFWELEAAMNARDHKIKVFQDMVRIVERAVRQYVGLDPFQDAEFTAIALVQPVGLTVLLRDFL
ncbi:hypothetical protein ABIF90_000902 [Bradyrhizobium japonicum]